MIYSWVDVAEPFWKDVCSTETLTVTLCLGVFVMIRFVMAVARLFCENYLWGMDEKYVGLTDFMMRRPSHSAYAKTSNCELFSYYFPFQFKVI